MALFGIVAMPAVFFLDRNDATERAPIVAGAASVIAIALYVTGRRLLACLLAIPIGIILVVKPLVRPVTYEGHAFTLHSETHYYFLISGASVIALFGWLLFGVFGKNYEAAKDSARLRILSGAFFIAGLGVGHWALGGPTVGDVIIQSRDRGTAMRKQLFEFGKKLPALGEFEIKEAVLTPAPLWIEGQRQSNNIEIVMVEELWNPDETPKSRNFYLSDELMHFVRWTGPKNPMASRSMGDQAGDFGERMNRAFGVPWLAAYRSGASGIDIFVYDLRTGTLVVATTARNSLGVYEKDRQLVVDTLAKATGGKFQLK